MLKQLIIFLLLFTAGLATAQEGTTSPYSFFGIGISKFRGTVENRSMSGMGVYSDSIHLNLQNPASVAGLRLVNYSIAGGHQFDKLQTEDESQQATTTSLDYLAIGIPMGKFGASFGLVPTTATGYKLENTAGDATTQFEGDGGLNKAFINIGYQITPKLSVGLDINYNFGNIRSITTTFQEGVNLGTQEIDRSTLRGFNYNFGAIYQTMVSDELQSMSHATFSPGSSFMSENVRIRASVIQNTNGVVSPQDVREIPVGDTEFTFPSQLTLGTGIGKPKKWFLGAEFTRQKNSNFTNRSFELPNVTFEDASKYKFGGFYIPNYNGFGSYFKRVVYRAGFRFEETGLNINGEAIKEFGITFGVGLPIGKAFSNMNIGFELGQRGTTNSGLVKETFFNTFISLSLNDRWFEKRYFD